MSPRNFTVPGASPFQASAALWGLCDQAGEQVSGDFVLTHLERVAIGIASRRAGVVPSGVEMCADGSWVIVTEVVAKENRGLPLLAAEIQNSTNERLANDPLARS